MNKDATGWILEALQIQKWSKWERWWSVQFSRSVVSNSLLPHGLQHARLPCPSPTSGAYSNSCPSGWWCHPSNHLILYHPLLLPPSIFPSIRTFSNESVLRIRWPKYWSFSFSISPSNEHSGLISFRMDWLDLLESKGLSRVFSNTTVQKHQFFSAQPSSQSRLVGILMRCNDVMRVIFLPNTE